MSGPQGAATITCDNQAVDCGDVLSGTVSAGTGVAPTHVALVVTVEADDQGQSPEVRVGAHAAIEANSGGRFELAVPPEGPITFDGTTLRARWELVASDSPWQPGQAALATAAVTVLPDGGLAVWARQAAPPPMA